MKKLFGWSLLLLPFAIMFTVMVSTLGWFKFAMAIVALIVLASCIITGVWLIWPENKP